MNQLQLLNPIDNDPRFLESAEELERIDRNERSGILYRLRRTTYPVLDNQGLIRVIDATGNDERIVAAARLTAQSKGVSKDITADKSTLLRYLMRHRHSTPFEFADVTLHIRVPMDCWRQWIRHRTASTNEYSTRYTPAIDERQTTPPDKWRQQAETNRQGSSGQYLLKEIGEALSAKELIFHEMSQKVYQERLDNGVAREQARKDLPLSTFTEAWWKINLHNLFHFLSLRMDSHAQEEIRQCAMTIGERIVKVLFPVSWQAFCDYELNAVKFSAMELEVLGKMLAQAEASLTDDMLPDSWQNKKKLRERDELITKLTNLGITSLPIYQ